MGTFPKYLVLHGYITASVSVWPTNVTKYVTVWVTEHVGTIRGVCFVFAVVCVSALVALMLVLC